SSGLAHADDVADEAQFRFLRGNQFYRQGKFEEALESYYASNRLVPNRNVGFNIARCLEQLKLYNEAFRAWSALAVTNAPETERPQPCPAAIRPAADNLTPPLARGPAVPDPPGATFYVNRRDLGALGNAPKVLALPPGKAKLLLDLPGFRPVEVAVEMVQGKQ